MVHSWKAEMKQPEKRCVVSVVFKGVSIFHIDHTDIDVQT